MFLHDKRTTACLEQARDDFYEYIYSLSPRAWDDGLKAALDDLGREPDYVARVAASAAVVPAPGPPGEPASAPTPPHARFIEQLTVACDFLEDRGYMPVDAGNFPMAAQLMGALRNELAHFTRLLPAPGGVRLTAPTLKGEFARFLARKCGCQIQFTSEDESWFGRTGFVSWLLVRRGNPTQLHVVFAEAKIAGSTVDPLALEQRFEKVFLHELAHARLHLKTLIDRVHVQRGPPEVSPRDEIEAMLYASTVRALAIGMGSRLDRLLGKPDVAWLG